MTVSELKALVAERRRTIFHACWCCGRLFITDNVEWTIEALRVCEITEEPWPEDGDDFPLCSEKCRDEAHETLGLIAIETAAYSKMFMEQRDADHRDAAAVVRVWH